MGSGNSAMKFAPLYVLLWAAPNLVAAQSEVICPEGKSKTTKSLGLDEYVDYKTQDGAPGTDYTNGVNCNVLFKRKKGSDCELKFNCTHFDLKSAKPAPKCQDKIIISKKKYCQTTGPDVTVSGSKLKVAFKTNKKGTATGAVCTAYCVPPPPPPGGGSGSSGYTQAWLRGPGNEGGHAHEGIELADGKGFVAAGSKGENRFLVMRVTAEASTKVWSASLGGAGKSTGITVIEVESRSMVVAGGGLHQTSTGKQSPVLVAFDTETGNELWQTKLAGSGHGCVRGVILDGDTLVATGYIGNQLGGFVFIAEDGSKAMAWRLDLDGNVLDTKTLTPTEGDYDLTQGAKIRADPINGGFVVVTTVWNTGDQQDVVVIKLDSSLNVEWNKAYGLSSGQDQVFDLLVDGDGNYVLGGHTTTGTGVVNWDYLAIKVDGKTKEEIWRRTYGQPRGFDPRYIHDEMYGVGLDQDGNYILLGGSGDEYPYSANSNGWSSDVWVSFLVTVSKDGTTLSEQVFGTKSANNAGEWVTVMRNGDLMVYTDSDTVPGFGFLKLTKN